LNLCYDQTKKHVKFKIFSKKTHALLGLTSSSSFSFSGMETIVVGLVLEVFEEFDDDLEGNSVRIEPKVVE